MTSSTSFQLTGEDIGNAPYHYTMCGLDGIYLLNGYSIEEYDGEQCIAIAEIDELHKAIGRHLVLHRQALSAKEIRFLRKTLDLTQQELAHKLQTNSQSVARWEKGEYPIPGVSEKMLRIIFFAEIATTKLDRDILVEMIRRTLPELDAIDVTTTDEAQFKLNEHWKQAIAA